MRTTGHTGYADPNKAPKADWVQAFKCDECEHLHVALMSETGKCIATAVVTREMLQGMFDAIDETPKFDA